MNRQAIAQVLIGIIAAVAGLWTATWIRMSRCLDAGNRWDAVTRSCTPAPGGAAESTLQMVGAYAVGAAVALALAVMLWRVFRLAGGAGPAR